LREKIEETRNSGLGVIGTGLPIVEQPDNSAITASTPTISRLRHCMGNSVLQEPWGRSLAFWRVGRITREIHPSRLGSLPRPRSSNSEKWVLCQLPGTRTEPAVASTISLHRIWIAGQPGWFGSTQIPGFAYKAEIPTRKGDWLRHTSRDQSGLNGGQRPDPLPPKAPILPGPTRCISRAQEHGSIRQ
jgi:hypothetical protein